MIHDFPARRLALQLAQQPPARPPRRLLGIARRLTAACRPLDRALPGLRCLAHKSRIPRPEPLRGARRRLASDIARPATMASSHPSTYRFPGEKLSKLRDDSKTPLVLVSCGSFSPITYLHLRMFEMCNDWVKENTQYEIVGGFLSPVADAYKKEGLTLAYHRIEMCRLATQTSSWISVDDWEASKSAYTRTALVLDHFEEEINGVRGGVLNSTGQRVKAKVALLSGADLIQTMSVPEVWADEDLDHILGRYGAFIIERSGTDMPAALKSLQRWSENIYPIPQLIMNDVSSTKIRLFLRKDMSIRYLIPEPAMKYIDELGLFKEGSASRGSSPPGNAQRPASRHAILPNGAAINGEIKS